MTRRVSHQCTYRNRTKSCRETHVIHHLVLEPNVLSLEELLQRLLLLTVCGLAKLIRLIDERGSIIPVNVAELVLSHSALQADGDIKRPTGRDSSADTGHGDNGDIFDLNVSGGFRDEHEALVQTEQETFVRLDRALDSAVSVMADEVFGWHDNLLPRQSSEDLRHHLVDRLFVARLQLVLVTSL